MTDIYDKEGNLDPSLKHKIETLRQTPERAPEAVKRGRQRFLAELDSIPEFKSRASLSWFVGLFYPKVKQSGDSLMNLHTPRFAFTTAAVLITVLILVFGGAGATALAAQSALPGDTLYPVKTGLETTRVNLAGDAYDQAQLYLSFAQRRLDEMAALVHEGRYSDVELASKEFEVYVGKSISALQTVIAGNPERGALLSSQITRALLSYESTLKGVQASVPDAFRPAVEQAIMTSQTNAGEAFEFTGVVESKSDTSWVVSRNTVAISSTTEIVGTIVVSDTVKVQAKQDSSGSLTALRIELSTDIDNGDVNNVDDGVQNNVDNGTPNPINDGTPNPINDGTSNPIDDGTQNNVDDGTQMPPQPSPTAIPNTVDNGTSNNVDDGAVNPVVSPTVDSNGGNGQDGNGGIGQNDNP